MNMNKMSYKTQYNNTALHTFTITRLFTIL